MRILLVSVQQVQTHTPNLINLSGLNLNNMPPMCLPNWYHLFTSCKDLTMTGSGEILLFQLLCLRMIVCPHQFTADSCRTVMATHAASSWHHPLIRKSAAEPVKRSLTSLLPPSLLQDLAAPGGDREDGQSLRHHHHTLHRRGPASQRGQITNLLINAHTCTRVHVSKQGQIRHKRNLISRLQRWNSLWCLYAAFYKGFPTVFPL